MQQNIVIPGYTLTAVPTPPTLTVTVTPVNLPAARTTAVGQSILITSLQLTCKCTGVFAPGSTFTGSGTGTITASTPRVTCEGQSMLAQGDAGTVTCPGTVTTGPTSGPGTATVQVTITAAGQLTATANKT